MLAGVVASAQCPLHALGQQRAIGQSRHRIVQRVVPKLSFQRFSFLERLGEISGLPVEFIVRRSNSSERCWATRATKLKRITSSIDSAPERAAGTIRCPHSVLFPLPKLAGAGHHQQRRWTDQRGDGEGDRASPDSGARLRVLGSAAPSVARCRPATPMSTYDTSHSALSEIVTVRKSDAAALAK